MMERGPGKVCGLETEGGLMYLLGTLVSPEWHLALPRGYSGSIKLSLSHLPLH